MRVFPVHEALTAQHRQLLPHGDVGRLVADVNDVHGLESYLNFSINDYWYHSYNLHEDQKFDPH